MSELPLPYVPISPALKRSKRFEAFVEAADLYDDPFAEFYIHKLLLFAGDARVDGNLGAIPARKLARECVWQGDPKAFVEALVASGWLEREESTSHLRIIRWEKYGGRVLKERLRWRLRHGRDAENPDAAEPEVETPEELRGVSAEAPCESTGTTASPPVLKGEGCRVKGEEEDLEKTALLPANSPEPPVITLTAVDKSAVPLSTEDVRQWSEAYPAVDVRAELRAMRCWLDANPKRRKTKQGMKPFVVNWLKRCQDKGGSSPMSRAPPAASRQDRSIEEMVATTEEYNARIRAGG